MTGSLRGAALLVVVDLFEIRVDDLVAAAARGTTGALAAGAAGGRTAFASAGLLRLLRSIERLAGRLVLGRNLDDAVGVDVEGHLDLRHAAWRRRDADQVELAEQLVVGRHLPFALEDPDRDRRLIVLGGRKGLALLGRDRCVA